MSTAHISAQGTATFRPIFDLGQMSRKRQRVLPPPPAPPSLVSPSETVAAVAAVVDELPEVDISSLTFHEFKSSRALFPETT